LVVIAAALLLGIIVAPVATSDVLELLAGNRPAWPLAGWASFSAVWFCCIAGFVLLVRVIASAAAPRSLRLLAALVASVGALTILDWTLVAEHSAWYFANLPSVAMNRGLIPTRGEPWYWLDSGELFVLRLLGTLLAFYVIIRARIVYAGPVLSRIAAYVIAALLVIAVFAFANVAFARWFPTYTLVVPLEILVAIAIGYWVSGLRDLAGCLSLACVDAWRAWAQGHAREERDALTLSLGLAKRTRRHSVLAEVRAHIAFKSWRDGEDGEFERNVDRLRRALGRRNLNGIRGFADAATSGADELCFQGEDLPEWKARGALVLCARTDDAGRARQLATTALASADRAGLPSLQVLASIAVAETCSDQRSSALERAHALARDAGWPALSKSILALRANSRDLGILQPFVEVRLRRSRPARPIFAISFFNGELRQNGARVGVTEKQLELLLTVASARTGIKDDDLIDSLWPEAEGDAARNSLRVCLHGLRKSAGDARIVTRVGKGFVLHPWADVDLWQFLSQLSVCRENGGAKGREDLRRLCEALRAGEGRRATLGEWFYRFDQMLARKLDEAERLFGGDALEARR
jgi:hypothetical protein